MQNRNIKRVLVTGGSGFIGTNLIEKLLGEGYEVLNFDIVKPRYICHTNIWREVDIINSVELMDNIKNFAPNEVYHLAAKTDLDSTNVNDYSANTQGVKNLIDACNAVDSVKRVIFASSRLVCRIGYAPKSDDDFCPTTAYGESKVIGENLIRHSPVKNFEWVIVRPTSIWGPWFGIPYRLFFDHVKKRTYVHPKGMSINKSFGYVGNSVFQLLSIMAAKSEDINRKMFYLCDYDLVEVGDFSKKIANAFSVDFPYSVPFGLMWVASKFGDLLLTLGFKNVPLTSFRLNNLVSEMIYDVDSLKKITGNLPFDQKKGVDLTVQWMVGDQ